MLGYNYNLAAATTAAGDGLSPALRSYDFHTTLANGYCYGRFDLGAVHPDKPYLNRPILQIGKYQGDMPFGNTTGR
ncbi:MAG: hypothetical protein IPM98_19240 [Lewinellaceae bacterium]|nr:hypothetical protein [Lewinellaceae bacterium]